MISQTFTLPTENGYTEWTIPDLNVSSDEIAGALFYWGSIPTQAQDNVVDRGAMGMGATDGSRQFALSEISAVRDTRSYSVSSDSLICSIVNVNGLVTHSITFDRFVDNGVRVNVYQTDSAERMITVVLFLRRDVENFYCDNINLGNTNGDVDISTPGFTADCILTSSILHTAASTTTNSTAIDNRYGARLVMGMADTAAQSSVLTNTSYFLSPTVASTTHDDSLLHESNDSGVDWSLNALSFDENNISASVLGNGPKNTTIFYVAFNVQPTASVSVLQTNLPTSTGAWQVENSQPVDAAIALATNARVVGQVEGDAQKTVAILSNDNTHSISSVTRDNQGGMHQSYLTQKANAFHSIQDNNFLNPSVTQVEDWEVMLYPDTIDNFIANNVSLSEGGLSMEVIRPAFTPALCVMLLFQFAEVVTIPVVNPNLSDTIYADENKTILYTDPVRYWVMSASEGVIAVGQFDQGLFFESNDKLVSGNDYYVVFESEDGERLRCKKYTAV